MPFLKSIFYGGVQLPNPVQGLVGKTTPPTHVDTTAIVGQTIYTNTVSGISYMLDSLNPATWSTLNGGTAAVNTVNSLAPVGGNIILAGTAAQITASSAGHTVTFSLPAIVTAPGSLAATTTLAAGTSITAGTTLTATLGAITATNGNLVLGTAGNKIVSTSVGTTTAAGANSFGTVTLVNGTATVNTTAVTANSKIDLWRQSLGATGANPIGMLAVGTITAGTSFVIHACTTASSTTDVATDVSVVGWMLIN